MCRLERMVVRIREGGIHGRVRTYSRNHNLLQMPIDPVERIRRLNESRDLVSRQFREGPLPEPVVWVIGGVAMNKLR